MVIKNRKIWIYLGPLFVVIAAALWGTETYFRVNLNTRFDSEVLVFYEHLFCLIFTLPLAIGTFKNFKNVRRTSWIYLILSGVIGSAIGTTFFTLSLVTLNPSVANVLLNFQPIISVLFASLLLRENLGKEFIFWGTLALICGLFIAWGDFRWSDLSFNKGLFYVALTALCWGFSTVAGRGAMLDIPLRAATAGRFLFGAIALFVSLGLKRKLSSDQMQFSSFSDLFIIKNYLWLSVVAGVIPLYFYFKGLSKTSASVAGFCELTQTFSALLLTWGIMHQALDTRQVVSGILLLYCVYMINVNFAKANEKNSGINSGYGNSDQGDDMSAVRSAH